MAADGAPMRGVTRKRKTVLYAEVSETDIESDEDAAEEKKALVVPKFGAADAEAAQLLGREIMKDFPGLGSFAGKISSFDATERLWQVTYDDGDQEELDEAELLPLLTQPATAFTHLASTPVEERQPVALPPLETEEKQLPSVVTTAPAFAASTAPLAPPAANKPKDYGKAKKNKAGSAGTAAAAAAAAVGPFTDWVVMVQRTPCNGRPGDPEEDELGRHATKADAIAAAKAARDSHPSFRGWAAAYWDQAEPPPYWSGLGQQQDQDEYTHIYIISPDYQKKRAARCSATDNATQPGRQWRGFP
jgi:hypothetical protein